MNIDNLTDEQIGRKWAADRSITLVYGTGLNEQPNETWGWRFKLPAFLYRIRGRLDGCFTDESEPFKVLGSALREVWREVPPLREPVADAQAERLRRAAERIKDSDVCVCINKCAPCQYCELRSALADLTEAKP